MQNTMQQNTPQATSPRPGEMPPDGTQMAKAANGNMSAETPRQDAQNRDAQRQNAQAQSRARDTVRPPVDVFESEQGITLRADLPGVPRDKLTVRVEGDTLTIEGEAVLDLPGQMEAVYAELRSPYYQRSFTLSSELDTSRIEAGLKDGVLTLTVPKHEAAKPRKIEIQAG